MQVTLEPKEPLRALGGRPTRSGGPDPRGSWRSRRRGHRGRREPLSRRPPLRRGPPSRRWSSRSRQRSGASLSQLRSQRRAHRPPLGNTSPRLHSRWSTSRCRPSLSCSFASRSARTNCRAHRIPPHNSCHGSSRSVRTAAISRSEKNRTTRWPRKIGSHRRHRTDRRTDPDRPRAPRRHRNRAESRNDTLTS